MAQPKPLTEAEIVGILEDEIRQAVGYDSSELSSQRQTALEYYYGEPFGNEVEGRSSYVSRDVADTIEWIMPSLMRIFTGGDTIVKFEPQGPEDEQVAQQATDYINYVFQKQNDGFLTLYTWFKDALLSKNGFVKVYRDQYTEYKQENYEGLTDDELALMMQDPSAEVLEHTPYGEGLHDAKVRKKTEAGKTCVVGLPPEEFLVNKNPILPLSKNRFRAHRRRVTISELKEMGFTDVDDIVSESNADFNTERTARFAYDETDATVEDAKDKANRTVWLTECLTKLDVDGDGIAEERTFIKAGNKLLQNEEGYTCHIVTLSPILLPHKLFGMSVADLVMDLQLLKSTVFRQILDNMYLANNGRYMALDGMVNIDDLLTSRPGGIVRVKTFDAVKPMQPPLLGAPAFNLLEYIDTIKENRTGVTRYNQGVDADSLNKTATGINQIMSASQQRVELIARIFAETGVKDLFYALLEMEQKHQDKPKVIRLRNEWVPMDPREWTNKFDLSVTVGLGTGSREAQIIALNSTLQFQVGCLQAGIPIVTPENLFNTATKQLEAQNIKGVELFYTHPSKMPPPPPQANPEAMKAELEKVKGEVKAALQEQKGQQDMMKEEQKAFHEKQQMSMQAQIDEKLQAQQQAVEVQKQREQQQVDVQKQREQQAGDHQMQREQQAGDREMQRENNAAQSQESDKQRSAENEKLLIDMLWEKGREEEKRNSEEQKAKLEAVLQMIQDNSKAQNDMLMRVLEAAMAERETEVTERDSRGKAKKTTSRIKKKNNGG